MVDRDYSVANIEQLICKVIDAARYSEFHEMYPVHVDTNSDETITLFSVSVFPISKCDDVIFPVHVGTILIVTGIASVQERIDNRFPWLFGLDHPCTIIRYASSWSIDVMPGRHSIGWSRLSGMGLAMPA